MKRASLLIIAGLVLLAGCGGSGPKNIGVIIDSAGKHRVNGPYVSYLQVKKNEAGNRRLWVGSANYPSATSLNVDLLDGWFVYAEAQDRVWVFDGDRRLDLFRYVGKADKVAEIHDPYSVDEIPAAILPRLPDRLKQNGPIEKGP